MFNLFKIEFYKLKKSKLFYFFIFLIVMQGIVVYIFSLDGYSKNLKIMNGKETLEYMFLIQAQLALNIMAGVFAADYVVTEFSSGYIKNLIFYGNKRRNIFISKAVVYYISVIILSCIVPVTMTVINTVTNGYGEVFTFNSLMFLIRLFLIMIMIQVSIASISFLVAFASKSANITMIVAIAVDFINRAFNIMMVQQYLRIKILNKIIFCQTSIILQPEATSLEFLQAGIVSLATLIMTISLGIYIFKKSDIK